MSAAPAFGWPVRVYWEDTDAGGVVYHSVYLNFFERARSEWLRAQGIDQQALRTAEQIQFVVVDMSVRWARPARYDDLLTVTARPVERRGATLRFEQRVLRGEEVLAEADLRVAAIHSETLRPVRIPAGIAGLLDPTPATDTKSP